MPILPSSCSSILHSSSYVTASDCNPKIVSFHNVSWHGRSMKHRCRNRFHPVGEWSHQIAATADSGHSRPRFPYRIVRGGERAQKNGGRFRRDGHRKLPCCNITDAIPRCCPIAKNCLHLPLLSGLFVRRHTYGKCFRFCPRMEMWKFLD